MIDVSLLEYSAREDLKSKATRVCAIMDPIKLVISNYPAGKTETLTTENNPDNEKSYVASLFQSGVNKIAQKVGEEAVEVVIEAKDDNDDLFLNESADLLFHYFILEA